MTPIKHTPFILTLTLVAALSGFGNGAHAAQASASASGTVVAPIAISAAANLVFGSFAPGAGGMVTVSTSGVRQASGPILMGAATPSISPSQNRGQTTMSPKPGSDHFFPERNLEPERNSTVVPIQRFGVTRRTAGHNGFAAAG